jgi:hypothetical protein
MRKSDIESWNPDNTRNKLKGAAMKRIVLVLGFLLSWAGIAASETLSIGDKAELQAAMFHHIDQQLVDGSFLWLHASEGRVTRLAPAKAHPKILRMGDHFVLCVDFRDEQGKDVNVDFFVARSSETFVVFHTEIENRNVVRGLMKAGRITALN